MKTSNTNNQTKKIMGRKVSDLPKLFLPILDEIVMPEGFKRKKTSYSYNRWINNELGHYFHLSFISHPGIDYDIGLNVGVKHLPVQKLLLGYREDMKPSEIKDTGTYGYELGQLYGGYPLRWTIDFDTDLEEVAHSIWETVIEKGTPFWKKYSDLKRILVEVYSPDPKDRKVGCAERAELIPVIEAVLGEKEKCVESFRRFYKETTKENCYNFVKEEYLKLMRYVCEQIGIKSPY